MPFEVVPPVPCTLLQASANPPWLGHGRVIGRRDDHLDIEVEGAPPELAPGSSLVVELGAEAGSGRAVGSVVGAVGRRVVVAVRRYSRPDKREYPRVEGALHVRFHVATSPEAVQAWLDGGPVTGPEFAPEPYMNFSVTGLSFEARPDCADNDILLLTIGVPQEDELWRAVGRVVRVLPLPPEERDESSTATHRVAVHFLALPDGAVEALGRHTLRVQDAWLGEERELA